MTRAKRELHLIAPLKYYLPQQTRRGDAHVYGAQSRFMTRAVMARLEPAVWPPAQAVEPRVDADVPRVDVAARLRGMWS